jgi:hypothetical protein
MIEILRAAGWFFSVDGFRIIDIFLLRYWKSMLQEQQPNARIGKFY